MIIKLTWAETDYEVTNFELTMVAGAKFKNLGASEIVVTLAGKPESGAFGKLYAFASDQSNEAAKKGKGTIVVIPAKGKESIETIEIENAFFADVHQSIAADDDKFHLTLVIKAANVTISGVKNQDKEQAEAEA